MWHQVPFFDSLGWLDLGLNPSLPDYCRTLYPFVTLKMDGTGATDRWQTISARSIWKPTETMLWQIGGHRNKHRSLRCKPGWSRPQVQFSEVVENICSRPSKTKVETAVEHESVGPKMQVKVFPKGAGFVR